MEAFIRGNAVVGKVDGTTPSISFKAENIRKTRTGIHARVEIYAGPHLLGYDLFNVERHPDRVRLANACEAKDHPKNVMRAYVDDFCAMIWPTWVTQFAPQEMVPNIDNLREVQFLLHPYIAEGAGTILFAPPKQFKSYMALLMAQSINQGCSAIWRTQKKKVLYLNLERSELSLERRLLLVNQVLGLDLDASMAMLNARGKTLAHVTESLNREYDLVILDSLSRSGAGSMVEDVVANEIMDTVNGLAKTWLVIAHTPRIKDKRSDNHTFGSQMFDAAADLLVSLKSVKDDNGVMGVQLEGHASNDVPVPKAMTYSVKFDKYGLKEFHTASASEFPGLADEGMDRDQLLREYLLDVGEATIAEITAHTGWARATAQRVLGNGHLVGRKKDGKRILYSIKAVS